MTTPPISAPSPLSSSFDGHRNTDHASLIAYYPVGYPSVSASSEAIAALAEAGADIIEVGVPYSDPLMDGPTIASAAQQALDGGVHVSDSLDAVRVARKAGARAVVMSYYNPLLRYGLDEYAAGLVEAGGDGIITPDLTPTEGSEWINISHAHDLDRIFLVAPSSTDERLAATVAASSGFVYAASTMGVTGARSSTSSAAEELVTRTRALTDLPVCVGLGVSNAAQAREIAGYADGVIVGSALVAAMDKGGVEALSTLARELVAGAHQ